VAEDTFEAYITKERNRLRDARQTLVLQRSAIDEKIAALDTEMRAITAYEEVKLGRGAPKTRSTEGSGRRTGQRESVLAVVKAVEDGITASQTLSALHAESDADKTSIRNALSALKRTGKVDLKDGKYIAK
jgi:hypothetical protein